MSEAPASFIRQLKQLQKINFKKQKDFQTSPTYVLLFLSGTFFCFSKIATAIIPLNKKTEKSFFLKRFFVKIQLFLL